MARREPLAGLSAPVLRRFIEAQLVLEEVPADGAVDDRAARAAQLLEEAIGLDPKQAVLWRYLAQAWASQPDPRRAAGAARRAVELDQSDARSHYVLGLQLLSSGSYRESEVHFLVALNYGIDAGSEHLPHYYLYEARRQQSDIQGALAALGEWRTAQPESSAPMVLGARLLWTHGRGAEASLAAAEALRADPRSEDSLQVLVASTPLDRLTTARALESALRSDWSVLAIHRELASLYEGIGRYDLALEHLSTLGTLSGRGPGALFQTEARLLFSMSQGDEALALLEERIAAGADLDGRLIRLLARSYRAVGETAEGIARLSELREQFPEWEARFVVELAGLREPVPGPTSAPAQLDSVAQMREQLDQLQPAWDAEPAPRTAASYQERVEVEIERVNLQLQLSFAQREAGDRPGCELTLLDILARHPRMAYAQNALAYLWAEDGRRLSDALRLQQRALEQRPYSGAFQDTLGWIHFRMGNVDEALSSLELANRYLPGVAEILEHTGDALAALGLLDEARVYFRRAGESLAQDAAVEVRERLRSKVLGARGLARPRSP
jgi:tetratricopeptide (TPR) repeat protein